VTKVTTPAPVSPIRMPLFVLLAISLLAGMGIFVVVVLVGTVLAFVATNSINPDTPSAALLGALLFVNALAALFAGLATGKMTRAHSLYTVMLLALMLSMSSLVPLIREGASASEPRWFLIARCILVLAGIVGGGALQRRGSGMAQER
jgi:hypothetical protein